MENTLKDLDQFSFGRTGYIPNPDTSEITRSNRGFNRLEWSDEEAFHVRDFRRVAPGTLTGMIAVSRRRDSLERTCQVIGVGHLIPPVRSAPRTPIVAELLFHRGPRLVPTGGRWISGSSPPAL